MDAKTLAKYELRAKIIKALGHPARLAMMDELVTHGEKCVCELTELVGADMSTVSRHLSQLKAAGLVEDEKRGRMIFYRPRIKCLASFFGCIESVIQSHVNDQQDLLTL
jgi:ArsR family transcriptional regulator